jgi:predicted PurR-regulated permease PerM
VRPDDARQVRPERVTVRISPVSAAVGVAIVVLFTVGQRIFVAAHRPLSWAVAAAVVAVLIDPLVGVMARRIPRLLAVLLALLVLGGAAFGVVYRAFDEMSSGLDRLGDAAQDAADQVEERDDNIGQLARDIEASRRVEDFVVALEDRATGGEEVLASTAGTAPTYLIGAILTIFLMSYGPRLARSALAQVPADRQEGLSRSMEVALVRARRAVLFTLGEGIVAGSAVALTATALDVPAPAALGLAAGVMALLPHVGLVLGSLPLLLLMLGLQTDGATLAVTVVVLVAQLLDSTLVRPALADRSVHVGLLVPWAVALVGYAAYGVGGAAYSLAIAVFVLALIDERGKVEARRAAEAADRAGAAGDAGAGPTDADAVVTADEVAAEPAEPGDPPPPGPPGPPDPPDDGGRPAPAAAG